MSQYNDYDYGSNVSDSDDDMSFSSNRQKVNKFMSESVDDKLCFSVQRWTASSGKPKKVATLFFASGTQGNIIRNAVTGEKYCGHRVGSRNEDLYFKVINCVGDFTGNKGAVLMFYDSPEQCERHMSNAYNKQFILGQNTKDKVAIKQRIANKA